MKTVSNEFYEKLRGIKETNAIITYKSSESTYILTTEDNDYLATEINDFIGTEKGNIKLENIKSLERKFSVNMLKSVAKAITITSKTKIPKNTWVNLKIGILINDSYEYEDEGNFYILEEPTYEADTETYTMIGYDKMYESMTKFDNLNIKFPISVKSLIIAICDILNWKYNNDILENIPNANSRIETNVFDNQGLTYRDVLDDISTITAGSLLFDINNYLIWKSPTNISYEKEIDDANIENVNASIIEKYGPVNKLIITTGGNITLAQKEDINSINQNGETIFNINENKILNYNTNNFLDELFDNIKGLEYCLYDLNTMGLLIYEPLDGFKILHNDKEYNCLMLNSDLKMTSGLKENISVEKPTLNQNKYTSASDDVNTKKTKDAYISLDKAKAQLVLKVDSDGKIASVRLDGDANDGSVIEIKADNIKLEGYTTINNGFSVDLQGNMLCNNATMNNAKIVGGDIELIDDDSSSTHSLIIYNQNKSISTSYSGEGIDISNPNGQSYFRSNAINWQSPHGQNFSNFIVNSDALIYTLYEHNLNFTITNMGNENHLSFSGKIICDSLEQTSLQSFKKNFEKYTGALEEIKNIDIYKYNLKNEKDGDKKHLGFVIGDDFNYSKVVTSNDNKGVDNYSFTSLCLQAIKEQQEQIELLKEQLNDTINIIKEIKDGNNKN